MLGPALTHLLEALVAIPKSERSAEQAALVSELAKLFAALPFEEPSAEHKAAIVRLHNNLDPSLLGFTAPWTGPYKPGAQCNKCKQYFPVSTQPP